MKVDLVYGFCLLKQIIAIIPSCHHGDRSLPHAILGEFHESPTCCPSCRTGLKADEQLIPNHVEDSYN
jgi:hypothetical protein